jgi:DNA-binding CsgD family transcriptional regulator
MTSRRPVALLGRSTELTRLSLLLDDVLTGTPRLVLCVGEPGTGRTALLRQFAHEAADRGVEVLWAPAFGSPGAPPYWLWRHIPGLPDPVEDGDAGTDRLTVIERLADHLARAGTGSGVMLVVDDVEEADDASADVLLGLVRSLRAGRILICVVGGDSRDAPDGRRVWACLRGEPVTHTLPLGGLDADAAAGLLETLLDQPVPAAVANRVAALTAGNPLLITEWGRWLADRLLDGWPARIPATLEEVLAARTVTLSPQARQLLHAGAVLGDRFRIAAVAKLLDLPTAECLGPVDEIVRAGLLSASVTSGWAAFHHSAVRATIAAGMSLTDRVRLHQLAAVTIRHLAGDQLSDQLGVLTHHWSAAAAGAPSAEAYRSARHAGDDAMRRLAHPEAWRLYRLALDHADAVDPVERAGILPGAAAAAAACGELRDAQRTCRAAVDAGRRLGLPDLIASAALTLEPVGESAWDGDIHRWCTEALAVAAPDDATRVRLLARLTQAAVYCGLADEAGRTSTEALRLADVCGDADATVAALGARQLVCSGPDDTAELTTLAERMIAVGTASGRPQVELWGRLWLVDTHWYDGRLAAVAAETARLQRCADQLSGPYPRWHLTVTRAALALARAEFDDAERLCQEGVELLERIGHPGARGASVAFRLLQGHHRGHPDDFLTTGTWDFGTDSRWDLFGRLGHAFALADSGRLDEAATLYSRCGAPRHWPVPAAGRLVVLGVGAQVAAALGQTEDVNVLRERLLPYRDRYIAGGAGATNFLGPVDLTLGKCAAALGQWDTARDELTAAGARCREIGAAGFRVEADCELAAALAGAGDRTAAATLANQTRPLARALGMGPWVARLAALTGPDTTPLTAREQQVAALVADGLSNKAIARQFVISERTVQNHVQHIFVKLGLDNRAQLAVWMARQRG